MASKLTQWINASLKNKGMTAKQAQKGAGKYKSIAAAKKAGSLYYKDKNGKIQIAAYAEDLKKIPKVKMDDPKALKGVIISKRPVVRGQSQTNKNPNLADTQGKEATILRSKTTPKVDKNPLKKVPSKKTTGEGTGDPYNSGRTKVAESATKPRNGSSPRPKNNDNKKLKKSKGGPVTKKPKGAYAAGGMPMVMKGGKKVPAFAADGKGKMNKGGMTKKAGYMYGGMAAKKKKK